MSNLPTGAQFDSQVPWNQIDESFEFQITLKLISNVSVFDKTDIKEAIEYAKNQLKEEITTLIRQSSIDVDLEEVL